MIMHMNDSLFKRFIHASKFSIMIYRDRRRFDVISDVVQLCSKRSFGKRFWSQRTRAQATVSCYTKRPLLRLVPRAEQRRERRRNMGYFTPIPPI